MPPTNDHDRPTDEQTNDCHHVRHLATALNETIDDPLTATVEVSPETYELAEHYAGVLGEPVDTVLLNYAGLSVEVDVVDEGEPAEAIDP